jgi:hypothetical protein
MQEISSVGGSARTQPQSIAPLSLKPSKFYSIFNSIICFRGIDEPVLEMVHNFLTGYYFAPVAPVDEPIHLIEIHKSAPPALSNTASSFAIEDGRCFPSPKQIVLCVNGSTIVVGAPESKRTDIYLAGDTAAKHPLALNNVILYAVQAALRRAGMYQFHAGCVLAPDQADGILLVGDSGCGKSTLTATLVRSGWQFVSDDNLLLRDTPGGVVAWALRRYFTFDESTLNACGLLKFDHAIRGRVPGDREKFRFFARDAFPESFVESCMPRIILFPRTADETRSRIEPLKPVNVLMRLIRQCPWATCDTAAAPNHLKALSRLTTQSKSYSLVAGRDVFESPAAIAELIAPL